MRARYAQPQSTTKGKSDQPHPPVAGPERSFMPNAGPDQVPLHPLIRTTQKVLRGHEATTDGILCAGHRGGLDIDVSPALLERALMVMNALVQHISAREWTILVRDGRTEISVGKHKIPIRLREALTTVAIPAKDRPNSWDPKTKFIPKGILQFRILSEYGVVRQFEDSRATRLEQKTDHILTALQEYAAELQRRADEAQVRAVFERYERLEKLRDDQERRELERQELSLLADVDGWHQSRRIREYLAAFTEEFEMCCGPVLPKSEAHRWLRWAHDYADSLDPIKG